MRKLKPSTVKTEKKGVFGLSSSCGLCGKEEKFVCVECYLDDYNEIYEKLDKLEKQFEQLKRRIEALEHQVFCLNQAVVK